MTDRTTAPSGVTTAERTVARLDAQADKLRMELADLGRKLTAIRQDVTAAQLPDLKEANEQLVISALHAEQIAATAVSNLDELARTSQRDALTDTPNRAMMLDRLENAIHIAQRHHSRIAVLFLDLDDFKSINDTLGHAAGDEVMRLVSRRLESAVRHSDTVSRHGGDEFLVLVAEISQAADAGLIASKMLASLAESADIAGHVLRLSASIGISIYPQDGTDASTLISRADAAMYRSKGAARGGFRFYDGHIPNERMPPKAAATMDEQATHDQSPTHTDSPLLPELLEANQQLVIAAMTAQDHEERAAEAHRKQIRFQAMIAHELRGPLTPIRTAADLFKQLKSDEPLVGELQMLVEHEVLHMSRLIDDLRDSSTASAGQFRLACAAVDLMEILRGAVEKCRGAIELKHQHFHMSAAPGNLSVLGDSLRLTQVFSNLLENASRYTPDTGNIEVNVEVENETVKVTISDTGIGIGEAALPAIFEMFTRDERAVRMHRDGLGVGLSIARDLIESHQGTVIARSAGLDLGSEFVVTLPLLAAA